MALTDPASVLIVETIQDVVTAVFDDPMAAIHRKDLRWRGHLLGAAGNAVGQFSTHFAGFLVAANALDQEGLADVGKIDEFVDCFGDPDAPGLDSAVEGWGGFRPVRL